jgi:hypothetical protein
MRPQVWCGDEKPTKDKMISILHNERYRTKPKGGLWTSPLINGTSPWIKFSEGSDLYNEEKQKWVLIPTDDSKILHLETKKDLMEVEVYKTDSELYKTINYEDIFGEYDAVHASGSMLSREPFRFWDRESILWNNWKFKDVVRLKDFV